MPVQSWGGVGSGAGTQGLPYGQGFNQVTGQPFPAFASQAAALSTPAAPAMSSQQQVAYSGGLTAEDQAEINRIRGPFTGGGQQGWQYQEAIQRVYDRAAARGRTPASVPSAQAISFSPGGYTGSTGGATAFAPANGSNGLTAARSAPAVPSSYGDILQGYADMEAALDGQGQSQLADIARRYGGYEGKTVQNAISRGLAPQYAPVGTFEAGRAGTPLASMLRGLRYDQEAANRAAMEGINSQRLGIQQQRLSAAERIQSAQAQQANQQAQLELERQRLAQQNAQFQQSLNQPRYTSGGGSSGGGGGVRQGSGGLPNLGQTGIVNYGQLDRFGYYAGPTGSFGYGNTGGYTGAEPTDYFPAPYTELPGATYDFGMGGGGYGGDWGTGFDYMGG